MLKRAVQQGRSERRPEAYPLGYVEGLNDARTLLADFFSILLKRALAVRRGQMGPFLLTSPWVNMATPGGVE